MLTASIISDFTASVFYSMCYVTISYSVSHVIISNVTYVWEILNENYYLEVFHKFFQRHITLNFKPVPQGKLCVIVLGEETGGLHQIRTTLFLNMQTTKSTMFAYSKVTHLSSDTYTLVTGLSVEISEGTPLSYGQYHITPVVSHGRRINNQLAAILSSPLHVSVETLHPVHSRIS